MANDPRLNLAAYAQISVGPITVSIGAGADPCSTSIGQGLSFQANARISASQILPGNIGAFANLEAGIGGGTVGAGLSRLAAISDSIRVNGPPTASNPQGLPVSTDPNAGPEFVLEQVGLSSSTLSAVGQVNTSVAAAAHAQARTVYNQVQGGVFGTAQITAAFSPFQNATVMVSAIFSAGAGSAPPGSGFGAFCGAKPYAMDLIALAPKYKFLFVVQFEFHPEFQEIMNSINPAFVIKNSSRPQVDFEYQDVNMYNFRTKVPAKTLYQPITMKFYDDDYNNAFQLYATYMKMMSPIANIDVERQYMDPLDAYEIVGGGMGFEQKTRRIQTGWPHAVGQGYAASLGPFGKAPGASNDPDQPDIKNILRRISIFHVYKQGRMMNAYHFYNPKITSMMLDDLDMASNGEGSEVGLTFSYDSVYIIPGYNILTDYKYNLTNMTDDGMYPFGITPGSVSPEFSSRDGTGRGGLDFGQNNLFAADEDSDFVTTPASVAKFNPNAPSSITGTSANLPNVPASVAGGINTAKTLQGNTPGNLSQVTNTTARIIDPVTGSQQDSANNTGNLGNVLGQNSNAIDAANAAARAANPQNLQQSVAVQQTTLNKVKAATDSTINPSTTYNSGGGSGGGGGGGF